MFGFIVILWRGIRAIRHHAATISAAISPSGITTVLVVQAFINISVVLGLVPTKGIPLPMISYGGSSLMVTLASLGILHEYQRACRITSPAVFVMAGGGTGGHVIPALAVARELAVAGYRCLHRHANAALEARLVPAAGFPLEKIEIGGLKSLGLAARVTQPLATSRQRLSAVRGVFGQTQRPPPSSAWAATWPARPSSPRSSAAFPVVVDGAQRRARRYQSLDGAVRPPRPGQLSAKPAKYFPQAAPKSTGLPVRAEFFAIPPKAREAALNILITGGSQGSRTLNVAARDSWPLFRKSASRSASSSKPDRDMHAATCAPTSPAPACRAKSSPFIDDMPAAFAPADLIVCRSGAGAVAELAAAGKPAILVPFPFAADDHQMPTPRPWNAPAPPAWSRTANSTGQTFFD